MHACLNLCFFERSWKICHGFRLPEPLLLMKFLICYCSEPVLIIFSHPGGLTSEGFVLQMFTEQRVFPGAGLSVAGNQKMLRHISWPRVTYRFAGPT